MHTHIRTHPHARTHTKPPLPHILVITLCWINVTTSTWVSIYVHPKPPLPQMWAFICTQSHRSLTCEPLCAHKYTTATHVSLCTQCHHCHTLWVCAHTMPPLPHMWVMMCTKSHHSHMCEYLCPILVYKYRSCQNTQYRLGRRPIFLSWCVPCQFETIFGTNEKYQIITSKPKRKVSYTSNVFIIKLA